MVGRMAWRTSGGLVLDGFLGSAGFRINICSCLGKACFAKTWLSKKVATKTIRIIGKCRRIVGLPPVSEGWVISVITLPCAGRRYNLYSTCLCTGCSDRAITGG